MQDDCVLSSLENGILTITINRPDKLNALNVDVIEALGTTLASASVNDAVGGIIITGAGSKSFVAGADISQFPAMNGAAGRALASLGQERVFSAIEQLGKPVIAAVNGFALGGGCELAMACHIRIASEQAKFGQPEVNLGLVPGYGGTQRLVHLVGRGKAMELCLTGAVIAAQEAHRLGLVNEVTTAEELLPRANAMMTTILQKAPLATATVIRLINTATYDPANGLQAEIDSFGALFDSSDAKEGATAFLEKRKPTFTGK